MGVLLQAAYRGSAGTVPAPSDGDRSIPWWWDRLAVQAQQLRLSGFSAVLLPPVSKCSAGAGHGADGYGVFDDYDIGSKDQMWSVPTRFGSRERLQRCVATLRGNGLDVYLDTVPHQRDGSAGSTYRYLGANGAAEVGRFAKDPKCFYPHVPRDPIAGPVEFDYPFGDELCPVNALPHGYVMNGLIAAGDWLTRSLDVQGYRVDDVKGLAVEFVQRWLTSESMATRFAVGEYFDGNPQTLNWWVWDSGMGGRCNLFDFSLRFTLAAMCANASNWDMRQLDRPGLVGISPANAVTFIENPDTDGSSPVIANKILAYAYLLTSEGYPCVFYKDYATDPGCYGLAPSIDNLIWIHENLAFGTTTVRFADFGSIVYERQGFPGLLTGLNNDTGGWRTITAATSFGPNVRLHDYTGHSGDVWTDGEGNATIAIPPNDNGFGYVAYSRTGYGQAFSPTAQTVTQQFEGASDLDIGPVQPGQRLEVGRIWCDRRTEVAATLSIAWGQVDSVRVELIDADGQVVAQGHLTGNGAVQGVTKTDGWHTVVVTGAGSAPTPFQLSVTYLSTSITGGH